MQQAEHVTGTAQAPEAASEAAAEAAAQGAVEQAATEEVKKREEAAQGINLPHLK